MSFSDIDFNKLRASLCYLYVDELKIYCNKLHLCIKGKKLALINRIIYFLRTGEKTNLPKYPSNSLGKSNTLNLDALMLKGAYKNDLKTRLFFKSIIGQHFHFTAFGIDWLEDRWMEGNPPTYKEFTDMWNREYEFRKMNKVLPKEEWAYINFVKRYLDENPNPTRNEILDRWEIERAMHKNLLDNFFDGDSNYYRLSDNS